MTILSLCQKRAASQAHDVLLHAMTADKVIELSYKKLETSSTHVAHVLVSKDLVGAKCLLALESPIDIFIGLIACLKARVTPVLLPYENANASLNDLTNISLLTGAKAVLSQTKLGTIKDVCWIKLDKASEHVFKAPPPLPDGSLPQLLLYEFNSQDKAAIICLEMTALEQSLAGFIEHAGSQAFAKGIASYYCPHSSIGVTCYFLLPILANCEAWYLPRHNVIAEPISLLELISLKQLSLTVLETWIIEKLLDESLTHELTKLDLTSLKMMITTDTEFKIDNLDQLKKQLFAAGFDPGSFYPCYGRKELGFIATCRQINLPLLKLYINYHELCKGNAVAVSMNDEDVQAMVSCGAPLQGYEVRIMREGDAKPCNPFDVGEVIIDSPYLAAGFYHNDRLNKKYFIENPDGSKHFKTGHLGFINENGDLFISGNVSDITLINKKFINLNDFQHNIAQECAEIAASDFLVFKETLDEKNERLVILLETELEGNDLTNLYDKIVEISSKEIELKFIFIAVFTPGKLPKVNQQLDREDAIEKWLNKSITSNNTWQLPITPGHGSGKQGLISLQGLSDRRKGEKLAQWLYAWMGMSRGVLPNEIDDSKHLAFYGYSFIDAIKLAHELELVFNLWVRPAVIWEFNNLKALTRFLFSEAFLDDASPTPVPMRSTNEKARQVTCNEQTLYELTEKSPDNLGLYLFNVYEVSGVLDTTALNKALNTVTQKHQILRTGFIRQGNELQRKIHTDIVQVVEEIDLGGLPPAEQQPMLASMLHELERERFDDFSKPLWRVVVYKMSANRFQLVLMFHRMVIDEWSGNVLLRDLTQCYNAEISGFASKLDPDKLSMSDYAEWQRNCIANEDFMFQSFYWENRLESVEPMYQPYDNQPSSDIIPASSFLYFTVEKELYNLCRYTSYKLQADLYTYFITAYQLALFWFNKENNLSLRCNQPNRQHRDFFHVAGNLAEHIILQENIFPRSSVEDLIALNRESLVRSCQNIEIPYQEVLKLLDSKTALTMPNCAYSFNQFPQVFSFDDIELTQQHFMLRYDTMPCDSVNMHLALFINPNDTIDCRLQFRKSLFNENTMSQFLSKYAELITTMTNNAHMPIQHLIGDHYAKPKR